MYRNTIKTKQKIELLAFREVYDRVTVFFNGIFRGVLYRNDPKQYLEIALFIWIISVKVLLRSMASIWDASGIKDRKCPCICLGRF